MRTLLVITRLPAFAAAIEAATGHRIICRDDAANSASLLARSAIDAIILDLDPADAPALRAIAEIHSLAPEHPLVIFTVQTERAWDEDAFLHGAAHILEKPVRGKLLSHLLERAFATQPETPPVPVQQIAPTPLPHPPRGMEILRRFSSLLVHSLDARELLQRALLQLREALGINRAAVFLRRPDAIPTGDHWLRPAYTIGHEPGLMQEFPLSLATGIGQHLHKHARILRADSPEARANREITKEFSTLGSTVALPVHDREMLLGVLVIDERITGGGFADEELAQLFHWLEELGIALRNCWRHDQLAANHGLIDDILAGLGSGCVVVGTNCGVLHANAAALRLLLPERPRAAKIDFAEIPQQLGSIVFQVIQKGESVAPFKWQPPGQAGVTCRVSIQPFNVGGSARPNAALLVLDDITEHERAAQLELETGKLRLVRQMAWHLAHEVGNAVTPISTMQQLLELQGDDPEVRREMSGVLAASVRRITRLSQQMTFLSREWDGKAGETVAINDLIESAYADAHSFYPGKHPAGLILDKTRPPFAVSGDTRALKHAFSELILNALQANPENPTVTIRAEPAHGDSARLAVEVQDAGPGFPQEVMEKIGEPFQSTRSVGLGLGLTVSRKIIENHHGQIEIPHAEQSPGIIRVTLPLVETNGAN